MPTYFSEQAGIDGDLVYASLFAGNFSFLLSLLVAVVATVWVFRAAKRMRGGLFASVLHYIGTGMLLLVLGALSSIIGEGLSGIWPHITSNVCFSFGFVFMVLGANRMIKGIM